MYQEGSLRPPTQREMDSKHVPLEGIQMSWYPSCWDESVCPHETHKDLPLVVGTAVADAHRSFTTLDLIEFHKDHVIPYEAFLVADGYDGELALDWSHLS